MPTVAQIEESIQTLPPHEFFSLLGWMTEQHLKVLADEHFEAPELEAEILKAVNSPRFPVDEALFENVRSISGAQSR